jgi:hypothetical protein
MEIITVIAAVARIAFVIVTTVIFSVALLSYSRLRTKKMLILAIGFGLFFVHGVISIPELFISGYNRDFTDSLHILIDSIALAFILFGALKD